MSPGIAAYTRMLRRTDEISYLALIIGMATYKPDPVKAAYYVAQRRDRSEVSQCPS